MENKTKAAVKGKKNKKPILSSSAKRTLVIVSFILVLVISVGGFFAYIANVPAMLLTGAEITLTPEGGSPKVIERIKVNELKYLYSSALSQLSQYQMLPADFSIEMEEQPIPEGDRLYNSENPGKTYREYIYEHACLTLLQSILIEKQARNDKDFKPEVVEFSVRDSIQALRDAVKTNTEIYGHQMTADQYLTRLYGSGITVTSFASFLERELIADEYMQYLLQYKFMPTPEELRAEIDEMGKKTELVTFHYYFFRANFEEGATEEQKAAAKAEARSKADELSGRATDPVSFRNVSAELSDDSEAESFMDGKDPTYAEKYSINTIKGFGEEAANFFYSPDRVEGDKAVFDVEAGSIAVYYLSRQLDEERTFSYRSIRLHYSGEFGTDGKILETEKEKTNLEAAEIMAQVSDEASFALLAKQKSEDSSLRMAGGLVTGVPELSLFSDDMTLQINMDKANWLTDPDRKPGDMTVLKADEYVEIYFFKEYLPAWQSEVRKSIMSERYDEWMMGIEAQGELSFKIKYGNIDFATY